MARRVLITQRAYARRIGVSQEAVRCAIKAGRISTVRGKIDPAAADREWLANTDQSKPRNRIIGNPKHRRDPKAPPKPMDLGRPGPRGGNGSSPEYSVARAEREVIMTQLAKLQLGREAGKLVKAEDVKRAAFDFNRKIRDQLLALPERMIPLLSATQDPNEMRRIVVDELERVCRELSNADGV